MSLQHSHYTRKLAVILHADVVGSTALVQANEVIAHERIQKSFNHFSEIIDNYGGIAHEIRGDALVAEFSRASDAVCAAMAFQARNAVRNEDFADRIIPRLRIGISLGEVVVADKTITGTGVIVAQRLEQLAEPGGVVVQGTISETVPARLPFEFESLGERKLKGFEQPVRAFTLRMKAGAAVPISESRSVEPNDGVVRSVRNKINKPSIAVLPFDDMNESSDRQFFSDGLTEDLITELSRFREFLVIARHSSFAFKEKRIDIPEIGRQLGVEYIVEGSVRRSGNNTRITAQLIDVKTGGQIWAERYDRIIDDVFAVLDDLVRSIAVTLAGKVEVVRRDRAREKPTSSMDAYDWLVEGRESFYRATPAENEKACEMFTKAVSLDSNFAAAHAFLAETHLRDWVTFWNDAPTVSQKNAWEHARTAVGLDETDSRCQTAVGVAHLFNGNHGQARVHLEKALALNSNDVRALSYMSRYHVLAGNPELAIEEVNEARRRNPFGKYDWGLVPAYYSTRRYQDAVNLMRGLHDAAPIQLCWLGLAHAQLGNIEIAKKIVEEFVSTAAAKLSAVGVALPQSWSNFVMQRWPFEQAKDREHFRDGLRKAGMPY